MDVFFLGYSMPETDLMVRFMVQNTLLDPMSRIFVVNKALTTSGESRVSEVRETYASLRLNGEMDYSYLGMSDVLPQFAQDYATGGTNEHVRSPNRDGFGFRRREPRNRVSGTGSLRSRYPQACGQVSEPSTSNPQQESWLRPFLPTGESWEGEVTLP